METLAASSVATPQKTRELRHFATNADGLQFPTYRARKFDEQLIAAVAQRQRIQAEALTCRRRVMLIDTLWNVSACWNVSAWLEPSRIVVASRTV